MEIGCGVRVRDFGGRRYVYFWHYERESGRSVREEEDIGRMDPPRTREDLLRHMTSYHRRVEQELARRRAAIERVLATAIRTSE